MSLQPGDVFAGYTVERELGAGGMGTVFLVRHPRLPRYDALKLLKPDLSTDPTFVKRFPSSRIIRCHRSSERAFVASSAVLLSARPGNRIKVCGQGQITARFGWMNPVHRRDRERVRYR